MDRSCICNDYSVLPAEAYVPARKGVAWQGPDVERTLWADPRCDAYRARRPQGGGRKEVVAAQFRDYHTLSEGLALYTRALCVLWNIKLSSTGVQCSRHVPRDDRVEGR